VTQHAHERSNSDPARDKDQVAFSGMQPVGKAPERRLDRNMIARLYPPDATGKIT
jgi:hypothetical protein